MTDDPMELTRKILRAEQVAHLALLERIAATAPDADLATAAAALKALVDAQVARDLADKTPG